MVFNNFPQGIMEFSLHHVMVFVKHQMVLQVPLFVSGLTEEIAILSDHRKIVPDGSVQDGF